MSFIPRTAYMNSICLHELDLMIERHSIHLVLIITRIICHLVLMITTRIILS